MERRSHDAHGRLREPDWRPTANDVVMAETVRGFTGHEHLDSVGLIHMNGRVYDPLLGRFLSADPFVQAPEAGQSFNRYTYAGNNPLSLTDPSGFLSISLKGIVESFWHNTKLNLEFLFVPETPQKKYDLYVEWISDPYVQFGGYIAASYWAGALGATAWSMEITRATGGDAGDVAKAGAITLATSVATYYIGSGFQELGNMSWASSTAAQVGLYVAKAVAHGVVQGVRSELQGGKFSEGLYAGAAGAAVSGVTAKIPGDSGAAITARTLVAATAGGIGAELGGGKFMNGALSGAFVNLLNDERDHLRRAGTNLIITNSAVTGNATIDRNTELLTDVLVETIEANGSGSGPVFGTLVHVDFANRVRALNLPGIGRDGVEQSFSLGDTIDYGLSGSIRTDVTLRNRFKVPIAVYDLKTGNAILTPRRITQIRIEVGVPKIPVIELRYRTGTAILR